MTWPKDSVRRVCRVAWSFSSTVTRISSSLAALVVLSFFQALFDGEAELLLLVVGFAGELGEAVMQGFASLDLIAVNLADEVREALSDRVEILLDGSTEGLVGGLVIASKRVESVLEEAAELGDGGGDLFAESDEIGGACLAGSLCFVGALGAETCEFAAQVMVESPHCAHRVG